MNSSNQNYIDFAQYNIWANNRIIEKLSSLADEQLNQTIEASFPSIMKTVAHLWSAEMGWLNRMQGNGWHTDVIKNFSGSTQDMFIGWQQTSQNFKEFVIKNDLEQLLQFDHKGKHYEIPFREIAQTVFTHGNYHRGQLVMMLRQLGITDIPQTDYIEWVRQQAHD